MSALRISRPGQPTILIDLNDDPEARLTPRQRRVLVTLRSVHGNRSRAARLLGVTTQYVQDVVQVCRRRQVPVPAATTGRRGRPDLSQRRSA
jgi:hypothetical protein